MVAKAGRPQRSPAVVVGPRLRAQVPSRLRLRSTLVLGLICVLIGAAVATVLASGIGFIVQALLHSVGTGP